MSKRATLLFIVILAASSLIVIKTAPASAAIPKPSVPEFTVKFVDNSYDAPATQSVDPYTGETVTQPAHRVENRSIEVRIKNQPFTPYQIHDSNGNEWTVNFFYNIRVKGHFGQDWTEVFHPSDGFPIQSGYEYTVLLFSSIGEDDFYYKSTSVIHAPLGGQVDFQVEAMIGYVHRELTVPVPGTGWLFTGETSGWSNTQTLTIPASDSSPASSPSPTSTPDQTLEPTATNTPQTLPTEAIIVAVIVVASVVAGLLAYFKKRSRG